MRLLHTMLRVGDMDRSIEFYTEVLGMTLLRRKDYPEGKFTLAFVGYGDEAHNSVIELTHNWGVESYELGTGYGHIALEVPDVYKACEDIRVDKVGLDPVLAGDLARIGPFLQGYYETPRNRPPLALAGLNSGDGTFIDLLRYRGGRNERNPCENAGDQRPEEHFHVLRERKTPALRLRSVRLQSDVCREDIE